MSSQEPNRHPLIHALRLVAQILACAAILSSLLTFAATGFFVCQELGMTSGYVEVVGGDGPLADLVIPPLMAAPITTLGTMTVALWGVAAMFHRIARG